jgi:hypothetical protein
MIVKERLKQMETFLQEWPWWHNRKCCCTVCIYKIIEKGRLGQRKRYYEELKRYNEWLDNYYDRLK